MESLGLQTLCAALTAGSCLSSEQTTAAAVLLMYVWQARQTAGTDGSLLVVCLVFLLFLLWGRVDEEEPTYAAFALLRVTGGEGFQIENQH